jgi:hypothetical protein
MTTFDPEILKALRHAWHALILNRPVNVGEEHDLVQRAARNADRQATSGTAEWYALALNSYAALDPRPTPRPGAVSQHVGHEPRPGTRGVV